LFAGDDSLNGVRSFYGLYLRIHAWPPNWNCFVVVYK
jgi:hypothetical protein